MVNEAWPFDFWLRFGPVIPTCRDSFAKAERRAGIKIPGSKWLQHFKPLRGCYLDFKSMESSIIRPLLMLKPRAVNTFQLGSTVICAMSFVGRMQNLAPSCFM